jgi:hypothetical protein
LVEVSSRLADKTNLDRAYVNGAVEEVVPDYKIWMSGQDFSRDVDSLWSRIVSLNIIADIRTSLGPIQILRIHPVVFKNSEQSERGKGNMRNGKNSKTKKKKNHSSYACPHY